LIKENRTDEVETFAKFFHSLFAELNEDLKRLAKLHQPKNRLLLEEFQKYISQASVEPYAIKRRHLFLKRAFAYYLKKGKVIR
jgi:hypothetical protein